MTEKLRNQKDTLAKLMSQEDITVVHKKIPTAYFDVKNRILACPIFKEDISPELYDLFMGHEVGHALNTPYEGLHSTLKENRTLKGYLNVIEDVRIESDIKNKFQGLRKSFYSAYNELMEMDFFSLKGRDLQGLSLIDKINLITKVGSRVNIKLTDEEQVFLDKAYGCKTWEDVVEVANEIYEWSKENETRDENDESIVPSYQYDISEDEFEDDEDDFNDFGGDDTAGDESSDSGSGDDESEDEEEVGTSSSAGDSLPDVEDLDEDTETSESDANPEETPEDQIKDTGSKNKTGREGGEGYDDENGARESLTEHAAHNNEDQFLSEENQVISQFSLKEVFANMKNDDMVVPYKKVIADFNKFYHPSEEYSRKDRVLSQKLAEHSGKKLVAKNKTIVSHMAKEFDMRQTAQRSVHAFTGKTGKLDMNRLAKYQIVDDVFKRAVYLPDGKNHGITVLLDWSGSISREVKDLIEQTLILSEFCKKVQIPFRVYLFSDVYAGYMEKDEGNIFRNYPKLIEVLSNEMSSKDHKLALTVMGALFNDHFTRSFSWRNYEKHVADFNEWFSPVHEHEGGYLDLPYSCPHAYSLGGTPLDQCLGYLRKLLPEFNKQYNIEKSILTIITDGYSHSGDLYYKKDAEVSDINEQMENMDDTSSWRCKKTRQLVDPYNGKVYTYSVTKDYGSDSFDTTQNLLEWISDTTGVTVTGYFVCGNKGDAMNVLSCATGSWRHEDDWLEIRKNGKVYNVKGYNKLFITSTSALGTQGTDELDDELIGAKKTSILAKFKKNQKSKSTSRFLTTEFIKEIA